MVGIHSANIAAALMSQTRASLAPAAGPVRPGGADAPALIVDVSGAARSKPEGYDLFKVKQRETLLDKQIEVAVELGDSRDAFAEALDKGDAGRIASEAYKLNGLLKAEAALSDEVEKSNLDDAKKAVDALARDGKEAAKELLDDAADAVGEAEETGKADGEIDLDKMAEEAQAAAEEATADAA